MRVGALGTTAAESTNVWHRTGYAMSPSTATDRPVLRRPVAAEFLRVGGLAHRRDAHAAEFCAGGAAAGQRAARAGKSVIMICLGGGASHIDTYDMRPDAPAEYRGEFRPAASKVPGMPMCELMPRQAAIATGSPVVRSLQWKEPCPTFNEISPGTR